jgi:isopentenyldiphosphate isomerase
MRSRSAAARDSACKEHLTEQFDVLDCTGRKTGARIGRDEAHAAGIWHGAFHCLILYRAGGEPRVLFQRRSREKQIAPGLYDVSAGGHYTAGEDASAAGPREVREELGLEVSFRSLVPLGRRVFVYCFTPGVFEYEFQDVFLLPIAARPEALVQQAGEVDAVLELGVEEGIALFTGKRTQVKGLLRSAGGQEATVPVTPAEFVPSIDSYYLKLLLLAERWLRGERDALAI